MGIHHSFQIMVTSKHYENILSWMEKIHVEIPGLFCTIWKFYSCDLSVACKQKCK